MAKKSIYSTKQKRKKKIKIQLTAAAIAAITAVTPIMSYTVGASSFYTYSDDDADITNVSTSTEMIDTDEISQTKFLFLNLRTAGGAVVLNEDTDNEQTIRLVTRESYEEYDEDGLIDYIEVYDKDDVLISSEPAEDNSYMYIYETNADSAVSLKAEADEGYELLQYEVTDIEGITEDVGFRNELLTEQDLAAQKRMFSYPLFIDDDKTVYIEFSKSADDLIGSIINENDVTDIEIPDISNDQVVEQENKEVQDVTISDETEAPDVTQDVFDIQENEDDLNVIDDANDSNVDINEDSNNDETLGDSESDTVTDVTDSAVDEIVEDSNSPELEVEGNDVKTDVETDQETELVQEQEPAATEHFTDYEDIDVSSVNIADFESMRLLVAVNSEEDIIDSEHIIGCYGTLYLMQYNSVYQAINAYMYYLENATAVEPDMIIKSAEETTAEDSSYLNEAMTEESNPIALLSDTESSDYTEYVGTSDKVIALIDTGVSYTSNIIDRVTMIGDSVESASDHGDNMVAAITSQNKDAKILSIKALDDNGNGTISSVIAAIEYAISQDVDIINLSMYARTNAINSVLATEIIKADSEFIEVVGAAGNDGADVKDYMPGSLDEAIIIGACNSEGNRRLLSNYGRNVSFYVDADSTSEAAAKFTGHLSKNQYLDVVADNKLIFDRITVENKQVDTDLGNVDNDNNQATDGYLKVYFLLHDGHKEDKNTMDVFNSMVLHMPYTLLDDGTLHCQINTDPEMFDFNEDGMDEMCEVDVDINRGGHGTGENRQIPITEECVYDETTGYIDIPAEYASKDLTVTVWQSRNSAFYKTKVPDELKPDEDKNGMMTAAAYINDFPHGINPIFNAVGCNNATIKSLQGVEKGDSFAVSVSASSTWYVGYGSGEDQKDWSYVAGASEYRSYFKYGQIVSIDSCTNSNFVNIGTTDVDDIKNWLFVGCISDVYNAFAGTPHSRGNSYIECVEIDEKKTSGLFYLHIQFEGPYGQTAQTMAAMVRLEVEDSYLIFNKTLGYSKGFSDSSLRINIDTSFTIYSDYKCTNKVKTVKVKSSSKYTTSQKVQVKMEPGVYYMLETGRCPGTIVHDTKYKFEIKAGIDTKKLSVLVEGQDKVEKTTSTVKNVPMRFKGTLFTKCIEGTTTPVKNAVFKVEYSPYEDDAATTKDEFKTSQDHKTWYFKSNSKGNINYSEGCYLETWTNPRTNKTYNSDDMFTYISTTNGNTYHYLPIGYLRIKEVYVPDRYILDDETEYRAWIYGPKDEDGKYTIDEAVIKYTQGPKAWKQTGTMYNGVTYDAWQVRVQAKKIDTSGKSLAGAEFKIYLDESCKAPATDKKLVSDKDGMTNIVTIDDIDESITSVTYYCKETQSPDGYVKTDEVFPVTFTKAKFDELYNEGEKYGELKQFGPKSGIVNEGGWQVRVYIKKIDEKMQGLKNARFGIYTDAACTKSAGDDLISGSTGVSNIVRIPVDNSKNSITLYCKEKKAPNGYVITDEVFSVTFNKKDYDSNAPEGELKRFGPEIGVQNKTTKNTPTPTPEPSDVGAEVKKSSSAPSEILALKGYSLSGATFSVTSKEGFSGTLTTGDDGISNKLALPDNSEAIWVDDVFDAEDNIVTPGFFQINPVTTVYSVKETKAPAGHKINNKTKTFSVTMPAQANNTFSVEFTDDPIFCSNALDIEKLGVKGEAIENVVFKVEYFDADSADSEKLVKTWYLKTDETGHANLDTAHLDSTRNNDEFFMYYGKIVIPISGYIQVTEVAAPAEYEIKKEPVGTKTSENANLSFSYTNGNAIYNEYKKCRINIQKYKNDGSTPIAGVKFELKFVEQTITPTSKKHEDFTRLLNVGETLIRSTDNNGYVYFDNLDQGIYEITEVETQPGNTLLAEPIRVTLPLTMTKAEADSYGNVNFDSATEDVGYSNKWYFYECSYEVTNTDIFKLPMTGGEGVMKYGVLGFGTIAILGIGCVFYVTIDKKHRRKCRRSKK